ncbi:hypothetical protein [Bradyrhizobium retamae]|uniref:hypothetical protein n=1 Tax=Bradyrhizobium retamae TaxID=1300035 RepID=UPI0018D2315F|nr:hypothetical protein [Bradyrhizobium retamae]
MDEQSGVNPEHPRVSWLTAFDRLVRCVILRVQCFAPHIPVFDKSKRDDGTFSRSDFRHDPTSDVYHCPGGKRLGTSGTVHEGKTLLDMSPGAEDHVLAAQVDQFGCPQPRRASTSRT